MDEYERLPSETEEQWNERTTLLMIAQAKSAQAGPTKTIKEPEERYVAPVAANKTAAMIEYEQDFIRKSAIEASLALMDASDVSHCTSSKQVGEVMLKYIRYMMDEQGRASRLFNLNKKFGMACKRFGLTTSEVMREPVKAGLIRLESIDDVIVYYDPLILSKHQEGLKTEDRLKVRMEFINKAFIKQRKR